MNEPVNKMIPGTSQLHAPTKFSVNWYGGAIPTLGNTQ